MIDDRNDSQSVSVDLVTLQNSLLNASGGFAPAVEVSFDEMPSAIETLLAKKREGLKRVTPEEAQQLVHDGKALLIDTRPFSHRAAEGAIPGALIIERNVLEWRLDPTSSAAIPEAREPGFTPIIVCNDSYASSLAACSLKELGVSGATDLEGGFRRWRREGLPYTMTPDAGLDRSKPLVE